MYKTDTEWPSHFDEADSPAQDDPNAYAYRKPQGAPAARLNLYGTNFNEGGTPDQWIDYTNALRSQADQFNTGDVYVTAPARGGVPAGDTGIMPSHSVLYYGIVRAGLSQRYNGYPNANQTLLDQWAGTPTRYDGDAPLALQFIPTGPAPWLLGGGNR